MENLLWLIPALPFLAFLAIVLFTKQNKKLSASLAIGGTGLAWLLGWAVVFSAFATEHFYEHPLIQKLWALPTGQSVLQLGFAVDSLSAVMLFMVPFVCLMIFIYSWGYMGIGNPESEQDLRGWPASSGHVDRLASRFFAYISLFATGMLGLVLSDNLIMLFIFWEIMGLCSYLLIGFWFARKYPDPKRITPKEAGLKAFLTTRIGDVIMMAGMMLLYAQGAVITHGEAGLTFSKLFAPEVIHTLAETPTPVLGLSWASLIAILIFGGAMGKSSQFPLHVWLPDAMEGPTPVSALIHAATMVSAGVYLMIRTFPLVQAMEHGPALTIVGIIGAFTALFAALIAVAQTDIKRVLAYSTISQLGYMFAALGIGAYVAATFHLLTHAFFKALLFLSSGSVIHGVEHGEHHGHEHGHHEVAGFDANDMRFMGGLRSKMPRTFIAFLAGGLALSGFPLITAGFWSKDEILAEAWHGFTAGEGAATLNLLVYLLLALAAFLTAFYTWRQISMTFLGTPRTEAAKHGHESPASMTTPLLILAVFAIFGGFLGVPEDFPLLGPLFGANPFHRFIGHFAEHSEIHALALPLNWTPVLISVVLALGGIGLGHFIYGRAGRGWQVHDQLDPLEAAMSRIGLGGLYNAMRNKFYFDELYQVTIIRFAKWLAKACFSFDKRWIIDPIVNTVGRFGRAVASLSRLFDANVIDNLVNGTGFAASWAGGLLRLVQTGRAQSYLLVALLTVLMLLGLFSLYL